MLSVPAEYGPSDEEAACGARHAARDGAPSLFEQEVLRRVLGFEQRAPRRRRRPRSRQRSRAVRAGWRSNAPRRLSFRWRHSPCSTRWSVPGTAMLTRAASRTSTRTFRRRSVHQGCARIRTVTRACWRGAWRHIPELSARLRLDDYTNGLLATGTPHSDGLLAECGWGRCDGDEDVVGRSWLDAARGWTGAVTGRVDGAVPSGWGSAGREHGPLRGGAVGGTADGACAAVDPWWLLRGSYRKVTGQPPPDAFDQSHYVTDYLNAIHNRMTGTPDQVYRRIADTSPKDSTPDSHHRTRPASRRRSSPSPATTGGTTGRGRRPHRNHGRTQRRHPRGGAQQTDHRTPPHGQDVARHRPRPRIGHHTAVPHAPPMARRCHSPNRSASTMRRSSSRRPPRLSRERHPMPVHTVRERSRQGEIVADNPYRDRAHLSAYLAAVNPSVSCTAPTERA
jgi:hypothetical protein